MNCTSCGSPLKQAQKFCTSCGSLVSVAQTQTQPKTNEPAKPLEYVATTKESVFQPESSPKKKIKPPVNRKKLIIGLSSVVVLIAACAIAYWMLMPKPEEDALQSKQAYCQCDEQNMRAIIEAHEQFIKVFAAKGYIRRAEAWAEFDQLHTAGIDQYAACNAEAGELEAQLRGRFAESEEKLARFHQTFNQKSCPDSMSQRIPKLAQQAQEQITALKEPHPDMEKVRSDLSIRQFKWWPSGTIGQLATIGNLLADPDQYNANIHILRTTVQYQGQPYAEADLTLTYNNDLRNGWQLSTIVASEVRQHIVAPVGQWIRINSLSDDMSFNCPKRYWIKSGGYFGKGVKGGPDVGKITINRSNYYEVASRELDPVTIIFTFRNPNN